MSTQPKPQQPHPPPTKSNNQLMIPLQKVPNQRKKSTSRKSKNHKTPKAPQDNNNNKLNTSINTSSSIKSYRKTPMSGVTSLWDLSSLSGQKTKRNKSKLTKSFTQYVSMILTDDHRNLKQLEADVSNTQTYMFKDAKINQKLNRHNVPMQMNKQ